MAIFETSPPLLSLSFALFLLSSLAIFPTSSAGWLCHKDEAAALLDVKRSFGNPASLASWNKSVDCCTWAWVSCDFDSGRVTELLIRSPDLKGPISPSISQLSSLKNLDISGNVIGTIPPSIGKLTNLVSLGIYDNRHLTGTIPRELCNLQSLQHIMLSGNKLFGSIPDCFGKNLTSVDLSQNQLSGAIPANFMSAGVTSLFLFQNRLSGPIPMPLGDVQLEIIDISYNLRLTGDASFLLKEKGRLEEIYLGGNELEFDLSNVTFPLRMSVLRLEHNKIYGRIPRQISKLGMLNMLNLSYNRLCGPIPTAGLMKNFDASSFAHNKCLCGGPLKPCDIISHLIRDQMSN